MEDTLEKICLTFVEKGYITTTQIMSLGYTDIDKLIAKNFLKPVSHDTYVVSDYKYLNKYGLRIMNARNNLLAQSFFKASLQIAPNNINTINYYILNDLYLLNYHDVFCFIVNNYSISRPNFNLYIFLLSQLYPLPYEYQSLVKSLKYEDVIENNYDANLIRLDIIKQNYVRALNKLHMLNKLDINSKIIYQLLTSNINSINKKDKKVMTYIKNNQYEDCLLYLQRINKQTHTPPYFKICYQLVNDYLYMKNSNSILPINDNSNNSIMSSVLSHDYSKALQLCKSSNSLKVLLININNLIESLSYNNHPDSDNYLNNIIYSLKSSHNEKYIFLFENLFALNKLTNKPSINDINQLLNSILNKSFTFDISPYVQGICDMLVEENYEVAKIYYNILQKSYLLGESCDLLPILSQELSKLKTKSISTLNLKK